MFILMKTKPMSALLCALIMGSTIQATPVARFPQFASQPVVCSAPADFGMFMAHRQGKGITLAWTMTAPGEVAYFSIQRSYDGDYFEPVEDVMGNGGNRYRYTDRNVFPGFIHYKVIAFYHDGSIMESPVETVRIVSRK
jgi:hypothetical protein